MIIFLFILLSDLQTLYEEGKYFVVIDRAQEALKDTNLTSQDRAGIHTILAFCYVALDKKALAKLEFLSALAITPDLELDPVLTSPKIMKVFREAKSTFKLLTPKEEKTIKLKKNFIAFLAPGFWDIKNNHKKRGYLLLGWSSMSIAGAGISYYLCEKYHKEYLNEREKIEEKYQAYSFWYKCIWYSLGSLGLTYIFNLVILAFS
jgi:hypothetical protein